MPEIKITLQSDMCPGNGESVGNNVNIGMCQDSIGLPVIPGKRIKGCLKQAAELLKQMGALDDADVDELFGTNRAEGIFDIGDAVVPHSFSIRAWAKTQPKDIKSSISNMYTYVRGQTKMEGGVADKGSLRHTTVLNRLDPVTGEKMILIAPVYLRGDSEKEDKLELCCKAVKHMGTHRNRGLGWVELKYCRETEKKEQEPDRNLKLTQETDGCLRITSEADDRVTISYQVRLDSNIVMTTKDRQLTFIPGRSVLGCMASAWMRDNKEKNAEFDKLFLSGRVIWSDLTPVIVGKRSWPAPYMLGWLKYAKRFTNRLNKSDEMASVDKLKTLEGDWAVREADGWKVASVPIEVRYHHRHEKEGLIEEQLYAEESIPAGLVFGGTVSVPIELSDTVQNLLRSADYRFGRSKTAQYAKCSLLPFDPDEDSVQEIESSIARPIKTGERIVVILESDLLLCDGGLYKVEGKTIRQYIAAELGQWQRGVVVKEGDEEETTDFVRYCMSGGYHAKWNLFKPQVEVVSGGSVFCFTAINDGVVPAMFRLGELQQEGAGVCHVLNEEDMHALAKIEKAQVTNIEKGLIKKPEKSGDDSDVLAFRKKLILQQVEDNLSYAALVSFMNVNKLPKYYSIDHSRIRLMNEESKSLKDLKIRIESMKEDNGKEAGIQLLEKIFGDRLSAIDAMVADNDFLKEELSQLSETERKSIFNGYWKAFMRILLELIARDVQDENVLADEEELE